jgi:hypothetical protein
MIFSSSNTDSGVYLSSGDKSTNNNNIDSSSSHSTEVVDQNPVTDPNEVGDTTEDDSRVINPLPLDQNMYQYINQEEKVRYRGQTVGELKEEEESNKEALQRLDQRKS